MDIAIVTLLVVTILVQLTTLYQAWVGSGATRMRLEKEVAHHQYWKEKHLAHIERLNTENQSMKQTLADTKR